MKHLIISELLILSELEKKALRVEFDQKMTLILGANSTGKSSITKSIYHSFGAEPAKQHPRWKAAEVKTLVKFLVDGVAYQLLRDGTYFAVFTGDGVFERSFTRISEGLSPYLANLFDFGLILASRESDPQTPPPAFLFLPFYMDQDASWVNPWSSFDRLFQYSGWKETLVEYHTGVKNNAYYRTSAEVIDSRNKLNDAVAAEKGIQNVLRRLEADANAVIFSLDPSAYGGRIERMLKESQALAATEGEFRTSLSVLNAEKGLQQTRLAIAQKALGEISQDFSYLTRSGEEEIECPSCGTHYENNFAARFAIASDEDRVAEFIAHITAEIQRIDREISGVYESYSIAKQQAESIQAILMEAQGELTLQTVIESEGRRAADNLLNGQLEQLQETRLVAEKNFNSLKEELRSLDQKGSAVRRERLDEYAVILRRNFGALDVLSYSQRVFEDLSPYLFETGSTLPRALLAYQFAILELIAKYSPTTVCPIVIDAPNQQGQDSKHLPQILSFLATNQPLGTQMILAVENDLGIRFGGKVIKTPERKQSVLESDQYRDVHAEIFGLLKQSLKSG